MGDPATSIAVTAPIAAPRRWQHAWAAFSAAGSGASVPMALLLALLLGACAADHITDRRTGQQLICHDGRKSMAVSNADSFVHLAHGDQPGPCPDGS